MTAVKTICVDTSAVADATDVKVTLGTHVAKCPARAQPARTAPAIARAGILTSSARWRRPTTPAVGSAPSALRQKAIARAGAAVAAISGPENEIPVSATTRRTASTPRGTASDSRVVDEIGFTRPILASGIGSPENPLAPTTLPLVSSCGWLL